MTISTIRPNGSSAASYTVTGAANAQTALSDDSDASYIRRTSTTATASATIQFATVAITSSQKVKQIRLRVRASTPNATSRVTFRQRMTVGGITYFGSVYSRKGVRALATYEAPWVATPPYGGPWLQEAIDSLAIEVTDYATVGADRGYVYELYIDVDIANEPTTTVTAPTGTLTTSSRPDVSWTYSDTDGDLQSHYRVKIFTSAVYSAGGFNPDTSTAAWDSGDVVSSATSTAVGAYLVNGTYRAYVKTAKLVLGQPFWSDWAYSGFVENVAPPTAPTITTSYSLAGGYVTLSCQGGTLGSFSSQTFEIERSTDGGTTWEQVRNGGAVVPDGTGLAVLSDYEAKRGVTNRYRGRAIGLLASNYYVSAYGSTATVSVTNDGTWWFKPVNDFTLSKGSVPVRPGFGANITEGVGVYNPVGRSSAVVVSSGLQGETGSYAMRLTAAQWTNLQPILEHLGVVYVEDPLGNSIYVRFTQRDVRVTNTAAIPLRDVTVTWVEALD